MKKKLKLSECLKIYKTKACNCGKNNVTRVFFCGCSVDKCEKSKLVYVFLLNFHAYFLFTLKVMTIYT